MNDSQFAMGKKKFFGLLFIIKYFFPEGKKSSPSKGLSKSGKKSQTKNEFYKIIKIINPSQEERKKRIRKY